MNAHFDSSPGHVIDLAGSPSPARPQGAPPLALCAICGQRVAPDDAASHALAHELEQQDLAAAAAADGSHHAATDAEMAAALAAQDRAAAEARDAEAAAQLAAAEWGADGGSGGGSEDEGVEDAAHRAQLEELYFQEL